MPPDDVFLARAVVVGSALVYWAGVLVQARRIRRHIGRSPNVRPRGPKEKLLWVGWVLVVVVWLALPFLAGSRAPSTWLRLIPALLHPVGLPLGILITVAGYAGTLWCYAAMGDMWRMGVDRNEKTLLVRRGPYRFVRHPIYLFQVVMLVGVALQLPTPLSLVVLVVHFVCVLLKASDEESHLLTVHGQEYRDYCSVAGRLFPKWPSRSGSRCSAHPDDGTTR
jgi:protein-S-isoprenylcysteine O-methyltransferase Ste14